MKKTAATRRCPVCVRLEDEVRYLRQQLAEERAERRQVAERLEARGSVAAPPLVPDPKFVGEHGEPLMDLGGRMVPVEEYHKAMRGLDAALAGRAIETDQKEESIL